LRLLADKLVELEIAEEEVSYQTVRRILKKTHPQATPEKAVVDPAQG
jgi:hypothetical protein